MRHEAQPSVARVFTTFSNHPWTITLQNHDNTESICFMHVIWWKELLIFVFTTFKIIFQIVIQPAILYLLAGRGSFKGDFRKCKTPISKEIDSWIFLVHNVDLGEKENIFEHNHLNGIEICFTSFKQKCAEDYKH